MFSKKRKKKQNKGDNSSEILRKNDPLNGTGWGNLKLITQAPASSLSLLLFWGRADGISGGGWLVSLPGAIRRSQKVRC